MILHFKCHFCGVVVVVVVLLSILSFCIYTLRRKGVVEVLPFGPRNVDRPNFYFFHFDQFSFASLNFVELVYRRTVTLR